MKIIFKYLEKRPIEEYNTKITFSDLGYYEKNNVIIFYVINKNWNYHDMIKVMNVVRNICNRKWCLLNYKANLCITNFLMDRLFHYLIDYRLKNKEDNIEFVYRDLIKNENNI